MKTILLIEKNDKKIILSLTEEMLRALFDFQYIILDSTWENLAINHMEKTIRDFFNIVEKVIDFYDDGVCYKLEKSKLIPTKDKYYHSVVNGDGE